MRKRSKENFKSLTAQSSGIWLNPRRSWEDMCFALAGMDDIVSKYARLKYVGEERYYEDVWRYVYWEVRKMANAKGWKSKDKNHTSEAFIVRLSELAVKESTMSDLCRKCNGKGYVSTGYTRIDCFSCDGSGALKRTEKFRARFMGLSPWGWRRQWRDRFRREVLGILDVFEYEIGYQLGKRL